MDAKLCRLVGRYFCLNEIRRNAELQWMAEMASGFRMLWHPLVRLCGARGGREGARGAGGEGPDHSSMMLADWRR